MVQSTAQKNKLIHCWNEFDKVFIRYETPAGEVKTDEAKIQWYFVVRLEDLEKTRNLLSSVDIKTKVQESPSSIFAKIYTDDDRKYDLVLLLEKNGVETYEGDLMNDRKFYIDKEVEISSKYSKLYFDIETDDTESTIEIGRDMILSYAAVDDKGKTYFEIAESLDEQGEKKLLRKFLKTISKYDILMGWNTSGFDVPYLKARMRKYDLHKTKDYCWRERAHFDLLKRFRHIFRYDNQIRSFSLENISQHFLLRGKIPHTEKIIELWKNDKKKLEEYNIEDCLLVKALDEKLGVSEMMIRQCQWCGVPVAHFGLYSIIDAYILKVAHRLGKYGRTSLRAIQERSYENTRGNENPDDVSKDEAKYAGAIVLDPKIGRYDRVYTFDFKGLYPSMMRTSNIGYDSLRIEPERNCITNPGTLNVHRKTEIIRPTYFSKEKSVITTAITDLIQKRGEYKKLKLKMIEDGTNKGPDWDKVVSDEIIVKELANSTYGIMGLSYGRYFSVDIAESITLFGQWCILFAKKSFEERGYNVIYGDTDSIFVSTGKDELDVNKELDLFHEDLRRELKEKYNIDECFIELAFDKQYESLLLVNKKTYAGHVIKIEGKKTNEIYTRGLEYIKKNTFSFAAEKQRLLVEKILKEYEGKEQLKEICRGIKKEFYEKEFSKEELTMMQRVGKDLDDYVAKSTPLHVRLAQDRKAKTGVGARNTEVEYIVTRHKAGTRTSGVLSDDFIGSYDKDYYWENKTMPILLRITEAIFPETNLFEPEQNRLF